MKRCEELIGKTVADFSLHEDGPYGPEVLIEFTDGTVFNSCVRTSVQMEAKLLQKGSVELEPLQDLLPATVG